ncbi:unnamed protein product [Arabidopsis halleri]
MIMSETKSEIKSEDISIDKDDKTSELKEEEEEEEEEDCSDDQSSELGSKTDEKELDLELKEEKRGVSNYKSLLYEFDDYVASSIKFCWALGIMNLWAGPGNYGWFDPAELIPFEPTLEEKSQQTISKHFVRGVEEAMDEAIK